MEVIDSKPGLDTIRTDEVCWTLTVGASARRSLIRYFRPRILEVILRRKPKDYEIPPGFNVPERLVDIDPIEDLAWEIADRVIDDVQRHVEDVYDVAFVGMDAGETFTSVLGEMIEEVESKYLDDDELNFHLQGVFHMAFGAMFTLTKHAPKNT